MIKRIHSLEYDEGGELIVTELDMAELADIYTLLPASPVNQRWADQARPEEYDAKYGGASKWRGGITHSKQAIDIVKSGWKEGYEKVLKNRQVVQDVIEAPMCIKRRPSWSHDGDALDIDRALAGQWDTAYRTAKRQVSTGPTSIELIGSWGGNCSLSAEQMVWQGVQMLVAADVLEAAGYSVRLVAMTAIKSHGISGLGLTKIIIKDYNESLRMDAIAGTVCHAGIFRTLGFQSIVALPFNVGSGLGYVCRMDEVLPTLVKFDEHPKEGYSLYMGAAHTKGEATENVQEVIKTVEEWRNYALAA